MGITDGRSVVITDDTNDIGLIADGRGQRFGTVTGIQGRSVSVYPNEHVIGLDENGYLPGARLTDDVQIVTADDKSKIENHATGANDLDVKGIKNTGANASINHSPSHGSIDNPTEHANHTGAKINALADMAKGLYAIPSKNDHSDLKSSRHDKDGTGDDPKINPLDFKDGKKPQPINIPDIQNIQILTSDSVVEILQKLIDHLEKEPEPNPPSNLMRLLFDEYTKASLRNEDPWKLVEPGDINFLPKNQFGDVLINHLENMDTRELNDFLGRINTVFNEGNNPGNGFRADTLFARESDLPSPIHDNRVPSNGPNDRHQDTDPSINGEGRSDSWELRPLEAETMQADMHDNNPQTTADMAEAIHASRFGLRSQELSSNHQEFDSSESTYNQSNPWELPKIKSDSPVRDMDLENGDRNGMEVMGHDDIENIRPADRVNNQMDDKPSEYDDDFNDYGPPVMDYPE